MSCQICICLPYIQLFLRATKCHWMLNSYWCLFRWAFHFACALLHLFVRTRNPAWLRLHSSVPAAPVTLKHQHTLPLRLGRGTCCNSRCQVSLVLGWGDTSVLNNAGFVSAPCFTAHSLVLQSAPIVSSSILPAASSLCCTECLVSSCRASRGTLCATGVFFWSKPPISRGRAGLARTNGMKLSLELCFGSILMDSCSWVQQIHSSPLTHISQVFSTSRSAPGILTAANVQEARDILNFSAPDLSYGILCSTCVITDLNLTGRAYIFLLAVLDTLNL